MEHRGQLFGLFRRHIRATPYAPDLVQEAYARLLNVKDRDAIVNPEAYLYAVASNLLQEYGVRERYEASHLSQLDEGSEHMRLAELPSLEAELEEKQMTKCLDAAIKTLPRQIHRAMVLKYREGLTYDETGAVMDESPSMVKKYLARGVALCRLGMEPRL